MRTYSYGLSSTPITVTVGWSTDSYLTDRLGSIIEQTDRSGRALERNRYDPFGTLLDLAGHDSTRQPTTPFAFAGQYLDPATGLYQLRARQYDPTDGRFLEPDPVPTAPGDLSISAYAYVGDRPTALVDPGGEKSLQSNNPATALDDEAMQPSCADKADALRNRVVRAAMSQRGVPYVWAGASPGRGFDCSGLTMWAYSGIGVSLPHSSYTQFDRGIPAVKSSLKPGDLVFFEGTSPGHVGIYIGAGKFIHAPHTGDVIKVSNLSDTWYVQQWSGARRLIRCVGGKLVMRRWETSTRVPKFGP